MASAIERRPGLSGPLRTWSRRLHYYLGCYFLLFTWLFAVTGLLLNHSGWRFAEFWPNRRESGFSKRFLPDTGSRLEQAGELARQLGLRGEIEFTGPEQTAGRLDFRVARPGHSADVRADLSSLTAEVKRTDVNLWGVVRALHAFTGVHAGDPVNRRDWVWTRLWAYSMDALAVGLMVVVLSGICLWVLRGQKRLPGLVALSLGILACGLFCLGLAWIYG